MATVELRELKKVYPKSDDTRKKKKKEIDAPAATDEKKANLQITKEGVVAVQHFNLSIADKEFIVLVGPSGCGKSTTLRMIAGLEEITSGELLIDGKRMNDVEPKNRDIAMVFQNYALYPHMTVYQNMAFALKLAYVSKDVIDKKVHEAAKMLGIEDLLNRKPKALSGGQRQRVAIGRAIVRNPKVFLMDEPLSNLDAKLRNQMRAEIIKLRQRIPATFIYVTHDQTEAMTLGDRIVVMRDGYVQQIGTPQEVFTHPSNLFVAGFIGTPQMNFFHNAELTRENDKYTINVMGIHFPAAEKLNKALLAGNVAPQKCILGVRPEHTVICEANDPLAIHCKVDVSEMMGSQIHVHANADGKDVILVLNTADLPEEYQSGFHIGAPIHFKFLQNACHLFNIETEKNLI